MAGKSDEDGVGSGLSRRRFLQGVGVAAAVAAQARVAQQVQGAEGGGEEVVDIHAAVSGEIKIELNVNGKVREVVVEPRTTLLSALRDRMEPGLTGAKLVCNVGTCGACTVMLDGKIVYGCSILALDAVGREVTTVEGLGTPDKMSAVQAAFCEKDGMMCGFCTNGFVVTVTSVVRDNPNLTLEQLKEGCKGNFCRCGTFPHIFQAGMEVAKSGVKV